LYIGGYVWLWPHRNFNNSYQSVDQGVSYYDQIIVGAGDIDWDYAFWWDIWCIVVQFIVEMPQKKDFYLFHEYLDGYIDHFNVDKYRVYYFHW
jgi:hypothetical protein